MEPNVKKIVDAALAWTDNPTVKNAGALKSAVARYRHDEQAKKAVADKKAAPKKPAKKEAAKKDDKGGDLPPGVSGSTDKK